MLRDSVLTVYVEFLNTSYLVAMYFYIYFSCITRILLSTLATTCFMQKSSWKILRVSFSLWYL